jgi:hypothetical protein
MAQNNGYFTAEEWWVVIKYVPKGNCAKENYHDMTVTLGDICPSYSLVKKWVARFRKRHLKTEDEHSGKPTQVTVPENVNAFYSMILDDQINSLQIWQRPLMISWERVGAVIHDMLDMRSAQPNVFIDASVLIGIDWKPEEKRPLGRTRLGWVMLSWMLDR